VDGQAISGTAFRWGADTGARLRRLKSARKGAVLSPTQHILEQQCIYTAKYKTKKLTNVYCIWLAKATTKYGFFGATNWATFGIICFSRFDSTILRDLCRPALDEPVSIQLSKSYIFMLYKTRKWKIGN
jgi:hypothetical protein